MTRHATASLISAVPREAQVQRRGTVVRKLLADHEAAKPGQGGRVLRREGLYSSHLVQTRRARVGLPIGPSETTGGGASNSALEDDSDTARRLSRCSKSGSSRLILTYTTTHAFSTGRTMVLTTASCNAASAKTLVAARSGRSLATLGHQRRW